MKTKDMQALHLIFQLNALTYMATVRQDMKKVNKIKYTTFKMFKFSTKT